MTTAEAQTRYPLTQGVNPWLVTVSVMLPTFMEVLDTAIASVALPYIAGSLSSTNSEATWVLTSYLVANAVILPASNWFARRFGRKRFLLICVVIFTVASFFCGAAPSLAVILLARVLQGAGGGALQPLSQSILLESFTSPASGFRAGAPDSSAASRSTSVPSSVRFSSRDTRTSPNSSRIRPCRLPRIRVRHSERICKAARIESMGHPATMRFN